MSVLPTTVLGVWLYLYLVVDVWSRKVVAWNVAEVESAQIAADLVQRACLKERYHRPSGFGSRNRCQVKRHNGIIQPSEYQTMLSHLMGIALVVSTSSAVAMTVDQAAKQFLMDKAYISKACNYGRTINATGMSNFKGPHYDPNYQAANLGVSLSEAKVLVYGQMKAYQIACPDVW